MPFIAHARRRGCVVSLVVVGILAASTADAARPTVNGFVDGDWEGTMAWNVRTTVDDATGRIDGSGSFFMTFSGGIPIGTFEYLVPDATSSSPDALADLQIKSTGTIGISSGGSTPALIPQTFAVTGEVVLYAGGTFPVDFSMSPDELVSLPLDIVRIGCSFASGSFETRVESATAEINAVGGSLSVHRAEWAAKRAGDGGTSSDEQKALMAQLLNDGVALKAAIADGTFDRAVLTFFVFRAARIAEAVGRNTACNVDNPGLYTTAVAGIVTDILTQMLANHEQFTLQEFWQALVAGVESGAIGASAGAADDKLVADLGDIFRDRFTAAAAAANREDLALVATVANLLGDHELKDLALDELKKP